MVVRDSLLQRCRKVVGHSHNLDFTIELLEEHISILIIDHDRNIQLEGTLDIDTLNRIERLSKELRDPQNLMLYFEALKDSEKHDLIRFNQDHKFIMYLRSINGDFFPFLIQTAERRKLLKIDQDALKRMVQMAVDEKMALIREQFQGRERQLRENIQNRGVKKNFRSDGQTTSLWSRRMTLFLVFFIAFVLICCEQSDETDVQEVAFNASEKTKDTKQKHDKVAYEQAKFIQGITSIYEQFESLKERMEQEQIMMLSLKERLDHERSANSRRQLVLKSMEQQIQNLKAYLSINNSRFK